MVGAIVPVAYGRTGNFRSVYWRSKCSTQIRIPSLAIFAGKTFSSPYKTYQFLALMLADMRRTDVSRLLDASLIIDTIDVPAVCACLANFQFRFLFSCSFRAAFVDLEVHNAAPLLN